MVLNYAELPPTRSISSLETMFSLHPNIKALLPHVDLKIKSYIKHIDNDEASSGLDAAKRFLWGRCSKKSSMTFPKSNILLVLVCSIDDGQQWD